MWSGPLFMSCEGTMLIELELTAWDGDLWVEVECLVGLGVFVE